MGDEVTAATSCGPPVCVQILSVVALACFSLYCLAKGVSFAFFNWWYVLGTVCFAATGFAAFRVYDVCLIMARREITEAEH